MVPPASTVPLDFTSCYYQSSLLSFTSIAQIFQSGQNNHCSAHVCFSIPTILFMCRDPAPLSYRACVCVLIDRLNCRILCSHLLRYLFRGQHKIIPQYSRSKSSTKPPSPFLTCQFKMATRPLLFSFNLVPRAFSSFKICGRRNPWTRLPKYSANREVFCHVTHDETAFSEVVSSVWRPCLFSAIRNRYSKKKTKTFHRVRVSKF